MKRDKGWVFAAEKVDCGPLGELVGDLADQLVSSTNRPFEGAYEVSVHEVQGRNIDDVFGFFGASQLATFPHRADVIICNRTVECDATAVLLVYVLKAALVGVTLPPVRRLGTGHCIYRQLLSCVAHRDEV